MNSPQLIIPPFLRQNGKWYLLLKCGYHGKFHTSEIHPDDVKLIIPDNMITVSEGTEIWNWKRAIILGVSA